MKPGISDTFHIYLGHCPYDSMSPDCLIVCFLLTHLVLTNGQIHYQGRVQYYGHNLKPDIGIQDRIRWLRVLMELPIHLMQLILMLYITFPKMNYTVHLSNTLWYVRKTIVVPVNLMVIYYYLLLYVQHGMFIEVIVIII